MGRERQRGNQRVSVGIPFRVGSQALISSSIGHTHRYFDYNPPPYSESDSDGEEKQMLEKSLEERSAERKWRAAKTCPGRTRCR